MRRNIGIVSSLWLIGCTILWISATASNLVSQYPLEAKFGVLGIIGFLWALTYAIPFIDFSEETTEK